MVYECAGILIHHAREVGKTSLYVAAFDYGGPQLVFPLVHGEIGSQLGLLPSGVLASIMTEPRWVFLLLGLDGEVKAAGICCALTGAVHVSELRGWGSGDFGMAELMTLFQMLALRGVGWVGVL